MRRPKLRCVMCQDMQTENCHRNRESVPKCALAVPAVCVLCETARSQNKKAKKKKVVQQKLRLYCGTDEILGGTRCKILSTWQDAATCHRDVR